MVDDMPVIDAVIHAFNFSAANYANKYGDFFARLVAGGAMGGRPGYTLRDRDAYMRDWSVEDTANIAFLESPTDLAVYHVLPVNAFRDGSCSLEKAVEAQRRWPGRFFFYIGVDPTQGPKALDEMEEQYDALQGDVVGLKLYPNSWTAGEVTGWLMDDERIAYPAFEKARELGLSAVAVHKAVPLGPVEMLHYKVDDIDRAAIDFPELNFEIVHGGMAFVEETAWQLLRFPNVYVNLESTTRLITTRPAEWERVMMAFLRAPHMADRILWATGGFVVTHPAPPIEAFREFRFSDSTLENEGLAQITPAIRRKILAENFAAMAGVDLQYRLAAVEGDHFDRCRHAQVGAPEPFSTAPGAAGLAA